MNVQPRVLILENHPPDAEMMLRELRRAGFEPEWQRVETEQDYLAQLDQGWEIILADYSLPQFTGPRALALLQERGLDIPLIIVSGTIGEEKAVAAMKAGANDYVMKDQLARLGPAVKRELRDAVERRQRKQAEAAFAASELRYRRLFESAKDGILILDAETGMVVDVNPFLIELLGFSLPAFLGKKIWELGFLKDLFANQVNFTELQKQEYIRYENLPLQTRDGRQIEVEFVSNVYRVDNAKVIQCNIRDITARKRLEQERVVLEAQLRQQQKLEAIGTLAAGVAHEINNPINGVMNYAQLILDENAANPTTAEYAREITHETERIATIVHNLLQFARQEKPSTSPARLQDVIEQTLSLVRTVIKKDQIALQVDLPLDLPEIKCRSQQIQQVIMNLLTNARDALNEKYPGYDEHKKISISAKLIADCGLRSAESGAAQSAIRITVADHGAGIPPEVQGRIFDPFFSTKSRHQGTGLGLSISHGIVKEHHGQLWFETTPGEGTKFHVELPVDNGWEL